MEKIIKILKENKDVYAYRVILKETSSYQLFFVRQSLDMNRQVDTVEYEVSIFVSRDDLLGQATFNIEPSMNEVEITNKVNEAIKCAYFTLNKKYDLPAKSEVASILKDKGFPGYSLKDAAFVVADALFEADKCDKGYINSSEIFVNYNKIRLVDSNGNDYNYASNNVQIEFISTWCEKEEIELYKFVEFDHIDVDEISHCAELMLKEASNRAKAIKTPELGSMKIMLTNEYVKTFFEYFARRCNTGSIYAHMSDVKENDYLQDVNASSDKISIRLEPTLKGSTKGMPFDNEGNTLRKLSIIEKGKVTSLWGGLAFSQYLKVAVSGKLENMVASIGSVSEDDLVNDAYLEIISLSGFDIDVVTGDFGSEIRLAYLHKDNEIIPVSGGSISGNINDSLSSLRLSNTSKQDNDFIGPSFVILNNILVLPGK